MTFTGVDADTDLARLAAISQSCPAVEWGVLYSHTKTGAGRYPSRSWIRSFVDQKPVGMRCAIHLCGRAAHEWIAGEPYLRALALAFDRLQLNVFGPRTDVPTLRQALEDRAHPSVITQHHGGNAAMTQALQGLPNHAILFDGSGGRGRLPEGWPHPVPGVAIGYAGGLGPSTIAEQDAIIAVAAQGRPYWLDMEQSLRDAQDHFNLDQVQKVLDCLGPQLAPIPSGETSKFVF